MESSKNKVFQIASNYNGSLKIHLENLSKILQIVGDHKLFILSLNGRTRKGKSFTLCQCLKYLNRDTQNCKKNWINSENSAFYWQSDAESITSGIQLWAEPLKFELENEVVYILLMDYQGLFDLDSDLTFNSQLFTFSNLLSSYFIFNDDNISADVFEYFNLFLQYTKVTQEDSVGRSPLLFLIRDWDNEDEYSFGYHDFTTTPAGSSGNLAKLYFDPDFPDIGEESQQIRKEIRKIVQNIGVYALPHPIINLDPEINVEDWNENFKINIVKFVEWLFGEGRVKDNLKTVRGEHVSGNQLFNFVSTWASILEGTAGDDYKIVSLQTMTFELLGNDIVNKLASVFQTEVYQVLTKNQEGYDEQEFMENIEPFMKKALNEFESKSALGSEKEAFKNLLQKVLNDILENGKTTNENNQHLAADKIQGQKRAEEAAKNRTDAIEMLNSISVLVGSEKDKLTNINSMKYGMKQNLLQAAELEKANSESNLNWARNNLENIRSNKDRFNYIQYVTRKIRTEGAFGFIGNPTHIVEEKVFCNEASYSQAVDFAETIMKNAEFRYDIAVSNFNTLKFESESAEGEK